MNMTNYIKFVGAEEALIFAIRSKTIGKFKL